MAPEIVNKQHYDESCDMWSCGVVMYLLVTGSLPFKGKLQEETLSLIQTKEVDYSDIIWSKIDPEAKELVKRLLDRNTATRITAKEALGHSWIIKLTSSSEEESEMEFLVNCLRNFKTFNALNVLQKTTMTYIASQFSDPKEEQKYSKLFNELDKNKDGQVTKEDLYEAFFKLYKNNFMARADATSAIKKVDINGNGAIDYTGMIYSHCRILNNEHVSDQVWNRRDST